MSAPDESGAPAIPAWARLAEFEVKMESPEGDKAAMQVNEPLYIFEQVRNMRIGAEINIKRIR